MGWFKYIGKLFKLTSRRSFGLTGTITMFAIAILYGIGKWVKLEAITNIDLWWLPLIILGAVFLIRLPLDSYWIYKDSQTQIADLRTSLSQAETERDKALGAEQSLVLTPHEWAIGLSDMTGYPHEPANADWLRLKVAVHPISKPIDTLDLLIDKETIHVNYWPRTDKAEFNVYFNITEWRWKGEKQVELIAKVGKNMHTSGRIDIDFDVEPWGSHQI